MISRESVIFPILLAVAGISVGFFLDWLRHKRPKWFGFGRTSGGGAKAEALKVAEPGDPKDVVRDDSPPSPDLCGAETEETDLECPQCGGLKKYDVGTRVRLVEDAYGSLYECPQCLKFWYYDNVYAKWSEADETWIDSTWPGLRERARRSDNWEGGIPK